MSDAEGKGRKEIEKKARSLQKLAIEYVGIDAIRPNQYNPNRQSEHDFNLLLASITEDGFTQPVIVHRPTSEIVDGEHRWRAAKHLGMKEIPVVFVDMDPAQMRISTIRHNRARGSHDIDLEGQVLRELRDLGALEWAQDSLQLSDVELQRMMEDMPAPEALAADQHSGAWEPAAGAGPSSADAVIQRARATEALREQERRISAAKTEEERVQAVKDSGIYRMAFVFVGDEAAIVKRALGDRPAERILELCRSAT